MAWQGTALQGRAESGRAEHGKAGLGDQEAAPVLQDQGLGEGGLLAKLPGFRSLGLC